ncbi:MAG: hypothetical protein OXB88_02255 [Bacteriovoracales bacterium]|nr:hypothetical protein [Bacteriovoracales bacterium]
MSVTKYLTFRFTVRYYTKKCSMSSALFIGQFLKQLDRILGRLRVSAAIGKYLQISANPPAMANISRQELGLDAAQSPRRTSKNPIISILYKMNGWRGGRMVEPLTISREVKVRWEKAQINLVELAKRRWVDGCSFEQLAHEVQRSVITVKGYLRRLRNGEIEAINLGPERKVIMEAIEIEREEITEYLKSKGRA